MRPVAGEGGQVGVEDVRPRQAGGGRAPHRPVDASARQCQGVEAGSRSFHRFYDVVRELTSYPHVLPVHQGRAAERILFSTLLVPGQITLSNTHFDTTRANVELNGCQAYDLPCPQARDLDSDEPFKGGIDLRGLEEALHGPDASRIAAVIMTITHNGGAASRSPRTTSPAPRPCAVNTARSPSWTPPDSPRTPGWSPSTNPPTGTTLRDRSPKRHSGRPTAA